MSVNFFDRWHEDWLAPIEITYESTRFTISYADEEGCKSGGGESFAPSRRSGGGLTKPGSSQ